MYVQLISPNLSTVGQVGWCLSFVEDVFNTPHSYATATDAWNAVRSPHLDRALPEVSVPIWYSYFEGGINYGHVAVRMPGGGVLSSPYLRNGTSQWFKDIDECGRVLNCTYLGWSEDLAGVQIVRNEEDLMPSEQDVRDAFAKYELDPPTANQIAFYVINPWNKLLDDLLGAVQRREKQELVALRAQVADLQHKLDVLQVSNGNATKWQTLKTLLKELIT